jgi:flagellar biosynthesis/type III secretory pathway protein FliH
MVEMAGEKRPLAREPYGRMQTESSEEASRMIYEARLKADRDLYSRMQGAFREGWEEGRQDGLKEAREKIRREGLKKA